VSAKSQPFTDDRILALTTQAEYSKRALKILKDLGKSPYDFQGDMAAKGMAYVKQHKRLLCVAPTGSGKTLIAQLIAALLTEDLRVKGRLPRILVVVPSRGLVSQHVVDAAWMRGYLGLALHQISADTDVRLALAILSSWGVVFTTPVTIARRVALPDSALAILGYEAGHTFLSNFDLAIFDEIDTYLSIDELSERRDTFPALDACSAAGIPIVGFTGTLLTDAQRKRWKGMGFESLEANVPEEWLPFTRVRFIAIRDEGVIAADADIRAAMGEAFRGLSSAIPHPTWLDVKREAALGHPDAIKILQLCTERLLMFESLGLKGGKLDQVEGFLKEAGSLLTLTRFRHTAEDVAATLGARGYDSWFAHGGQSRESIAEELERFRVKDTSSSSLLAITRELGGRGLDFPGAGGAALLSPRSNNQAVAQELARIRSRFGSQKSAIILYYAETAEEFKAHNLGSALAALRFGERRLFDVEDLPPPRDIDSALERAALRYDEGLEARS
jgi:superfamily II DNA or RNA helicase